MSSDNSILLEGDAKSFNEVTVQLKDVGKSTSRTVTTPEPDFNFLMYRFLSILRRGGDF